MTTPVVAFGDWHGNAYWAKKKLSLANLHYPDARFVHVGDFGFWEDVIVTDAYMQEAEEAQERGEKLSPSKPEHFTGYVWEVETLLAELDKTLYVVLGNHENYWDLDDVYGYRGFFSDEERRYVSPLTNILSQGPYCTGQDAAKTGTQLDDEGFLTSELFPHIKIVPRAHVWQWDGVTYGSLGGATSIDVEYRRRGWAWWEQEAPTEEELDYLVAAADGVDVDVLFTHDGPLEATRNLYGHGHELPEHIAEYAHVSGALVQRAAEALHPKLLVCGHHHVRRTFVLENGTQVEILDKEDTKMVENRLCVTAVLRGFGVGE